MVKKKYILFLILFVFVSVIICTCIILDNKKAPEKDGLAVLGKGKYDWTSSAYHDNAVSVKSNGVILSGNVENDTIVFIEKGVDTLTIDNLIQGNCKIEIFTSMDEQCEIVFKNNNEIYYINSNGKLVIRGSKEDDSLIITGMVDSMDDVEFNGGTIVAEFVDSWGNVVFAGDCKMMVASTGEENVFEEEQNARIHSEKEIIFKMDNDGLVSAKGDLIPPIESVEGIKLINTEISNIQNYSIKVLDPDDNEHYMVYTYDNTVAKELIIKSE